MEGLEISINKNFVRVIDAQLPAGRRRPVVPPSGRRNPPCSLLGKRLYNTGSYRRKSRGRESGVHMRASIRFVSIVASQHYDMTRFGPTKIS